MSPQQLAESELMNEIKLEYIKLSLELGLNLNKSYEVMCELKKMPTNSIETKFYLILCENRILKELAVFNENQSGSRLKAGDVEAIRNQMGSNLDLTKKSNENQDELQSLISSAGIKNPLMIQEGKLTQAIYFTNNGKLAESIKLYEELLESIKQNPSAKEMLNQYNLTYELILLYFKSKDYKKCISLFTKDAESNICESKLVKIKYCLSIAELNTNKNWFKANVYLNEIKDKAQNSGDDVKYMLAAVNYRHGRFAECESNIMQISKREEKHEIYLIASQFWMNYAEFHETTSGNKLAEFLSNIESLNSTNKLIMFYKNFAKHEFQLVLNAENQDIKTFVQKINNEVSDKVEYESNGDCLFINGVYNYINGNFEEAVKFFNSYLTWLSENSSENVYGKYLSYFYKLCSIYRHITKINQEFDEANNNIEKVLSLRVALNINQVEFKAIPNEFIDQSSLYYEKLKPFKRDIINSYAAYICFEYEDYFQCQAYLKPIVEASQNTNDLLNLKYLICSYKLIEQEGGGQTINRFGDVIHKFQAITMYKEEVHYHLSNIYLGLKQYDRAIECIDMSIEIAKKKRINHKFNDRYYRRGLIYFEQQNFAKALANFEKQVGKFDQHFDSNIYIALCYENQPDLKKIEERQLLRIYDKAMFGSSDLNNKWIKKRAALYQKLLEQKKIILTCNKF